MNDQNLTQELRSIQQILNPSRTQSNSKLTSTFSMIEQNNVFDVLSLIKNISHIVLKDKSIAYYPYTFSTKSHYRNSYQEKHQKISTILTIREQNTGKPKQNNQTKQQTSNIPNQETFFTLLKCLIAIRSKVTNTAYQYKIKGIIEHLCKEFQSKLSNQSQYLQYAQQFTQRKVILEQVDQVFKQMQKGKQFQDLLDPIIYNGKFSNKQTLYQMFNQKILAVSSFQFNQCQTAQEKFAFAKKYLQLLSAFFHQTQLQVKISRNSLIETRIYNASVQAETIFQLINFELINSQILKYLLKYEKQLQLQISLFKLIRRFYYFIGPRIRQLLIQVITNISLNIFQENQRRQTAMFCYKIVNEKTDEMLGQLISQSDDFRNIRQSKYFSSKAYVFCNQLQPTYSLNQLGNMPFWRFSKKIANKDCMSYRILTQKQNTLLIYQFYVHSFDVKFGIYKVQQLRDYIAQDYQEQRCCKQLVKFERLSGTQKQPIRGNIFLKPGLYHLVFDNSYSIWRQKILTFMFVQLEAQS